MMYTVKLVELLRCPNTLKLLAGPFRKKKKMKLIRLKAEIEEGEQD